MIGTKRFSFSKIPAQVVLDNVVTVAELKSFLRVEHSADDALLAIIRGAAVAYVEEYTNNFIGTYLCTGYADTWANITMPVGPVTSISAVKYLKTNGGTYETLNTNKWFVDIDARPARIRFVDPPTLADDELNRVQITFTAGHIDSKVPDSMVHAIYMMVANMYEQRQPEVVGTITSATQYGMAALLAPHRIIFAQ